MPSIAELLSAARRRSFVGREKEIALFEQYFNSATPDCILLYVYGTGGQGKTTLFKHLIDICNERGISNFLVDAREIEPHPAAFMEALRTAVVPKEDQYPDETADIFQYLAKLSAKSVLFVDTYEKIAPLDDWIRTDLLPRLPSKIFTVIAGRNAPAINWLTDPGWKTLMKAVKIGNFSHSESEEYLRRRNTPVEKTKPIIEFTYGHPLALSVVADIYEQFPDKNFTPDQSPDVVRTLLQLFVRQVPSPMHRAALEICAIANILTESLLNDVLGIDDSSELFSWLCSLSFISTGRNGIYPHDVAREALCADLRWRHPDWNTTLHLRLRTYYHKKIREASGEHQRKVLFELLYLHRHNAVVKPFFDWQETGSFWTDFGTPDDLPVLREMIDRQEGPESLHAFDFWCQHPAAQIWVWRDSTKKATAFTLKINLHELPADKKLADGPMQHLLEYKNKHLHLRQGEQMAVFRFWMAADTHQAVSALQSSIFLHIVQYYFTPGLAASAFQVIYPEMWKPVCTYADMTHLSELDYTLGAMPFGWYMHDWRVRPPLAWLDLLGKREVDENAGMETEETRPQLIVLNEHEFSDQIAEALRHFHNTNQLMHNPLLRTRMISQHLEINAGDAERIAALREKFHTVIKEIEESPVDGKYHRVLYRTFINPVGSQEKTADFLNMSFSTYRRYLQAGVQRLTEMLWAAEIR